MQRRSKRDQDGSVFFNVRRYGATAESGKLQTAFLQKAIDDCAAGGGGTVVFPAGTYLTGTLLLKSGVSLWLQAGAVIQGSPSLADYQPEGRRVGLLFARDAHDVAIFGMGVINGNGDIFMDGTRTLMNGADGPVIPRDRPGIMVVFSGCRNVTLRDITLTNAPYWTLHFGGCDGVAVDDLKVDNNPLVPNNDGMHITSSRNVRVSNCLIRAGDDAIAVTGLTDHGEMVPGFIAREERTENVVVTNCVLSSRSAGIRVGYGDIDMRNCLFENIAIEDSNRGIALFVREAGSISDFTFSNIHIQTRLFSTGWWGNGEPIHVSCLLQAGKQRLGRIARLRFTGIHALSETGIVMWGSGPDQIRDVTLEDVTIRIRGREYTERSAGVLDLRPYCQREGGLIAHDLPGFYARFVNDLRVRGIRLAWEGAPQPYHTDGMRVEDFEGLSIDSFEGAPASPGGPHASIFLMRGRSARIRDCRASDPRAALLRHEGMKDLSLT